MPQSMLSSSVLIENKNGSSGSGTIIFSGKHAREADGRVHTYVLTNWHVIDPSMLFRFTRPHTRRAHAKGEQRERWKVKRLAVKVTVYRYAASGVMSEISHQADIVACDKEKDLALLRLRTGNLLPCARFAARTHVVETFGKVWAVGCPIGYSPFPTEGIVGGIKKAGRALRILASTPIFFGNSGGGLYQLHDETGHKLIGVTTEVGSDDGVAVAHLSLSIPIRSVYEFLERHSFGFIARVQTAP
ncbi:MAG: serine protease [Patescibacteria group bacterium]